MTATPQLQDGRALPSAATVQWSEHPLIDLEAKYRRLSDSEFAEMAGAVGHEAALAYVNARETRIRNANGYFLREGQWQRDPDPLRYGFDLPHWRVIWHYLQQREELFNFGANDSAKTTMMAKTGIKILFRHMELPGAMPGAPQICCIAQNDTMSKRVQQDKIYEYMPVEQRRVNDTGGVKKRSAMSKLSWSKDGGFTNGSFSLANPRGAAMIFRNVTQFERNELALEGDGFHFIAVDESCPLALLETLRFRAAKKGGRLLYCFTPIGGFDAVCNNVFTGARIIAYLPMQWDWAYDGGHGVTRPTVPKGAEAVGQWLTGGINPDIQFPELELSKSYVEGCPPGHMPFVMQPLKQEQVIVFTWSHWNPFAPRSKFNGHLPKIADKCIGRGHRVSLIRLFGFTDKLAGALIANFKPDYFPNGHLIKHADLLEILRKTPHNLRHGVDPATARSWFQGWKAVLPNQLDDRPMQYLVWESPNVSEGEWVTPDGEIGDGQRVFAGRDVDSWKMYVRETEARLRGEIGGGSSVASPYQSQQYIPDPILRAGDARGFASNTGEGTKYLELFYRDDSGKDPRLAPMIFRGAKVMSTVYQDVHDTGKLIDLFACDWTKPVDATNHPHLLVSDACQNFIKCVLNWDGKKQTLEGKPVNSPYADGVDMGRVLFDQELGYLDAEKSCVSGGGAW